MGIPKFFGYLSGKDKRDESKHIQRNYALAKEKKYDYLFLDYQSLCYTTLSIFSGEINFFIRLANMIKCKAESGINAFTENKYILEYILSKYSRYFREVKKSSPQFPETFPKHTGTEPDTLNEISTLMDNVLGSQLNTQTIVWDELVEQVIDLTLQMAQTHIKSASKYSNTFIFFDGIPTLAKVKEQLSRRVYPEIISTIKTNLYKRPGDPDFLSKTISGKLLSGSAPIGIDTYIVNSLRAKLAKFSDPILGNFYINDIKKYGEAEHQLMKYLSDNIDIFRGKTILLSSRDADLILLSLINLTKGIIIDIIRDEAISDGSFSFYPKFGSPSYVKNKFYSETNPDKKSGVFSPYKRIFDYINCTGIKSILNLSSNQEVLDVCYLLLLLGDDFIPVIPSITVGNIPQIISTYKELIESDSSNTIVQTSGLKYILAHENLKKFIILLASKINEVEAIRLITSSQNSSREKNVESTKSDFKRYKSWLFLDEIPGQDIDAVTKLYFLDKGFLLNDEGKFTDLIKDASDEFPPYNAGLVSEYLKGCQFIFDVYLNNEVRNYKWYFSYEEGPTLSHLTKFLTETPGNISLYFDYFSLETPDERAKYLNVETYKSFIEDNKKQMIKDIISKMESGEDLSDFTGKYNEIKSRHFTYSNVEKIFDCKGKKYFNKCIEAITLTSHTPHLTGIDVDMLGGKYYQKYLKYKQKYMKLKTELKL